jgi:hypothetical protein
LLSNARVKASEILSGKLFPSESSAYLILARKNLAGMRLELYQALVRRVGEVAAQALAVKTVNLVRSRRHFEARDIDVTSAPYGLVVDPSNVCQLSCPGCVHGAGPEAANLFDWPNGHCRKPALATSCVVMAQRRSPSTSATMENLY